MTITPDLASVWPPSRKFVRPKRSAEQEAFAKRVYDLLQRPARGKPQNGSGYAGHIKISGRDFEDHLFGGVTLAIACINEDGANFLAFDCDENFGGRLPIYAKVLDRRGLAQAAFATNGSTPARGKVVITLAKRVPQAFAVSLAKEIQDELEADPNFGLVRPGALTGFPSAGDGSYCRILGRKYGDPAPFEIPLDLDGRRTDLSSVVPAFIEVKALPTRVTAYNGSRISAWAEAFLSQAFSGSQPDLLRAQLRLAGEAIRNFGDESDATFAEWMDRISQNSPSLRESVRRQLHRADAFPKAAALIRNRNSSRPSWEPISPPYLLGVTYKVGENRKHGAYKVGKRAIRIYESLSTYALHQSLNPHALAMTYERIADLAGYTDKSDARKGVLRAEECELLYRLDPGTPRADGRSGLCTLFCLRGEGETLADAIEAGKRSAQYHERQAMTHHEKREPTAA